MKNGWIIKRGLFILMCRSTQLSEHSWTAHEIQMDYFSHRNRFSYRLLYSYQPEPPGGFDAAGEWRCVHGEREAAFC